MYPVSGDSGDDRTRSLQIPGATVASVAVHPAGIVLGLRLRRKKLRCPFGQETRSVYDRCRPGVSRSAAGAMDRAAAAVPAGPAEAGPAASARVAEEAEARAPARDERLPAAGSWLSWSSMLDLRVVLPPPHRLHPCPELTLPRAHAIHTSMIGALTRWYQPRVIVAIDPNQASFRPRTTPVRDGWEVLFAGDHGAPPLEGGPCGHPPSLAVEERRALE